MKTKRRAIAMAIVVLLVGLAAPYTRAAPSSPSAPLTPVRKGIATGTVRLQSPGGEIILLESTAGPLVFSVTDLKLRPATAAPAPAAESASLQVTVEDGVVHWSPVAAPKLARLSLLVLDPEHFVAWTTVGYFESSGEGVDEAVGVWSELADGRRHFFPIRDFSKDYRRPDLVRRALEPESKDGGRPLGSSLPMVGLVTAPTEGTGLSGKTVEVTVEVFSASAMASAARAAAPGERGIKSVGTSYPARAEGMASYKERVLVPLPPPPKNPNVATEITIPVPVASLGGRPASLHLGWDHGWHVALPDLYLLSVGINDYRAADTYSSLRFAVKDSQDVARALVAQQGVRYRRVYSRVVNDKDATLARLRDELEWLQQTPRAGDVAMLFLAGHGVGEGVGPVRRYYFLPSDVEPNQLAGTALSDEALFRALSERRAATVVLFIDSCRSGSTPAQRRLMEELQAGGGVVVYSATKANRPSLESARWQNGAFTHALVAGLRGGADVRGDGRITASGLESFLAAHVKDLTHGDQEPMTVKATTDLWLAQTQPPLYRRWWLWTAVGVTAAAGLALGIGLGVANQRPDLGPHVLTFNGASVSLGRP